MEKLSSQKIRELWKQFWESNNHKFLTPASLIPDSKDKTVLFTTAGMQQLVPYLVGKPHELWKRVYNIQKCVRTVDIEEVWDHSHLTCFEMMWNWSLWDYFKKESIQWSFEFLTKYLNIPVEKLAVTVFEWDKDAPRDDFSANIWKQVGMPEHKISYLGKKDNWWWPAGETWPCGPDTEIFYRVWKEEFPPLENNKKDNDEDRMEIWNNVFMEFYKDENKKFSQLSQQNVDTWMWFERICMVLQWVNTVYETDLFKWLIWILENYFKITYPYGKLDLDFTDEEKIFAKRMRIVCDHIRSWAYMIWDGVIPSNEWRWYVLRRLIRRMYYNLLLIDNKNINIDILIPEMINHIGLMYWDYRKELNINKESTIKIIIDELSQFQRTINKWLKMLEDIMSRWATLIEWKDAFTLYDTYGFPIELTREIANSMNFQIDEEWFTQNLELAKEKSRQGTKDMFKRWVDWAKYLEWIPMTQFIWYEQLSYEWVNILKEIEVDWQKVIIFDKTPFYAESWGQTGDSWTLVMDDWKVLKIKDVQKYAWVFLHFVE